MNTKKLNGEKKKELKTFHHRIAEYIYIQQLKNKIDYVEGR